MNDVTNYVGLQAHQPGHRHAEPYECPVCGVIVSSGHVCAMSAIQARIDTLSAERDAVVRAIDAAIAALAQERDA